MAPAEVPKNTIPTSTNVHFIATLLFVCEQPVPDPDSLAQYNPCAAELRAADIRDKTSLVCRELVKVKVN